MDDVSSKAGRIHFRQVDVVAHNHKRRTGHYPELPGERARNNSSINVFVSVQYPNVMAFHEP